MASRTIDRFTRLARRGERTEAVLVLCQQLEAWTAEQLAAARYVCVYDVAYDHEPNQILVDELVRLSQGHVRLVAGPPGFAEGWSRVSQRYPTACLTCGAPAVWATGRLSRFEVCEAHKLCRAVWAPTWALLLDTPQQMRKMWARGEEAQKAFVVEQTVCREVIYDILGRPMRVNGRLVTRGMYQRG